MSYQHILSDNEEIVMIVTPKKGIMLHANDTFKLLFILFFMCMSIIAIVNGGLVFLLFVIAIVTTVLNAVFKRYANTKSIYIITNKRVLFYQNNRILKSKLLTDLQTITYENSGNNTGYIILGKPQELFAGRGISFNEDEYVLDNLTNYNEVSSLMKSLKN
ncbi:MAG TPA: hypothetical protein VJL37_06785 [Flavobacterium sp.]|nr:hypothetical protein [Flavobacterium sp.]